MVDEKKCPECAEMVKADAKVCRFCGHRFDAPPAGSLPGIPPKPAPDPKSAIEQAKAGCVGIIILAIGLFALGQCMGGGEADGNSQAAAAKQADDKRKGFHCLSGWDGNSNKAEAALKETLRDPESLEIAETRITPVNAKGVHMMFVRYRAKNGFGGMNGGSAVFTVDNATCNVTLVSSVDNSAG